MCIFQLKENYHIFILTAIITTEYVSWVISYTMKTTKLAIQKVYLKNYVFQIFIFQCLKHALEQGGGSTSLITINIATAVMSAGPN